MLPAQSEQLFSFSFDSVVREFVPNPLHRSEFELRLRHMG